MQHQCSGSPKEIWIVEKEGDQRRQVLVAWRDVVEELRLQWTQIELDQSPWKC